MARYRNLSVCFLCSSSIFLQVFVADLYDGFAIATQEPWIQHATVRENILFGLAYDVDKYSAVIYSCALEQVSCI